MSTGGVTSPLQKVYSMTVNPDGENYNKLYKQLGPHHNNNKDVRIEMQTKMTEKIESPLSPVMWTGVNPRYHMDGQNEESHFMQEFKGNKDEDTDKIYFRKKDDMVTYAEHRFKSQIIMRSNKMQPKLPGK